MVPLVHRAPGYLRQAGWRAIRVRGSGAEPVRQLRPGGDPGDVQDSAPIIRPSGISCARNQVHLSLSRLWGPLSATEEEARRGAPFQRSEVPETDRSHV